MPTLSSVPEEKKLEEILAAIYITGTENGLGKTITDTSEIVHRKEAFIKANPVCKEAVALINQQIKGVLDELEKSLIHIDEHICRFNDGEQTCDCYKEADDITRAAIQKIRSRYE